MTDEFICNYKFLNSFSMKSSIKKNYNTLFSIIIWPLDICRKYINFSCKCITREVNHFEPLRFVISNLPINFGNRWHLCWNIANDILLKNKKSTAMLFFTVISLTPCIFWNKHTLHIFYKVANTPLYVYFFKLWALEHFVSWYLCSRLYKLEIYVQMWDDSWNLWCRNNYIR